MVTSVPAADTSEEWLCMPHNATSRCEVPDVPGARDPPGTVSADPSYS